jgi:pimeloyl-ACP methyl ester carboxylesterase
LTDPSGQLIASDAGPQAADFSNLPQLARQLGVRFDDATRPRDLSFSGSGGTRLHAFDWGGDGAPALFLHGGRLTARTWDYVCLGLRSRVHAVALDLRGHGDSAWADDYSVDLADSVADVGAVLDALGWRTAHLIGMSLGGVIAAGFAAATPQRIATLALVDVGPGVVFEATARMRNFFQGIERIESVEAVVDAAMKTSPESERAVVAYRMHAMLRRNARGDWRWAYDTRRRPDYPTLLAKVEAMSALGERLGAPCLVVRGGRSLVFSDQAAQRFAERFAPGEWIAVPDARHNVQEDNPAGLIAALTQFWSRHAG